MGFEPTTFRPAFQSPDHYVTGVSTCRKFVSRFLKVSTESPELNCPDLKKRIVEPMELMLYPSKNSCLSH